MQGSRQGSSPRAHRNDVSPRAGHYFTSRPFKRYHECARAALCLPLRYLQLLVQCVRLPRTVYEPHPTFFSSFPAVSVTGKPYTEKLFTDVVSLPLLSFIKNADRIEFLKLDHPEVASSCPFCGVWGPEIKFLRRLCILEAVESRIDAV